MRYKSYRPISLGAPGEEISRKDLNSILRRFLHLHRLRRQRLQALLTPRQCDCLQILPLLFHHNTPSLPGYLDADTPSGISDYFPNKTVLQAAKRLVKSFRYTRLKRADSPLQAMFLMGSVGSIAYSRHSDLDVWLCHRPGLDSESLARLQDKCHRVEAWAAEEGLEVHFFLIDPERFRQGQNLPLSKESAGSTQHYLLLEEFYRTAVHLAGRKLLWWLVPPDQEANYSAYVAHLLQKRFIDAGAVIDLGGLDGVPAQEFVSAGLWHLYKALASPYKSLLKIQLLECYASEYPTPRWLSTQIKQALFQGEVDPDALDPYFLLYKKVESALQESNRSNLLPLIRHSFLQKVNSASLPAYTQPNYFLHDLLQSWGLEVKALNRLDTHQRQRTEEILEEWGVLTEALEESYQRLRRFAHRYGDEQPRENEDLILLGRKLHAALERRPGKLEIILFDQNRLEREAVLTIGMSQHSQGSLLWQVKGESISGGQGRLLKQGHSLVEVLAWVMLNRINQPNTRWSIDVEVPVSEPELRYLCQALRGFRRLAKEIPLGNFRKSPKIETVHLFANIGLPTQLSSQEGFQITSQRYDPLSYGAVKACLLKTVDQLSCNSWGEILVSKHEGLEGLFECLAQVLNEGEMQAKIACHCYSSRTLAMRIEAIYQAMVAQFSSPGESWQVLRGGQLFYIFQGRHLRVQWWEVGDFNALEDVLAKPRDKFIPVVFDTWALKDSPLPLLFQHNREGRVQLYLQQKKQHIQVYILDERGAFYTQSYESVPQSAVLQRYAGFLHRLQQRYANELAIDCFQLNGIGGDWQIQPLTLPLATEPEIDVRVYAEEISGGQIYYTLLCNREEFTTLTLGDNVFSRAAERIRQLRRHRETYPVYLSDLAIPPGLLGVSSPSLAHTAVLLAYKRKMEARLNMTL